LKASEKTRTLLQNCIKDYPVVSYNARKETSSTISEREYYNILVQCQEKMPPDPSWSSLRDAIHLQVQALTAKEDDQSDKKKVKTQGPEQEKVTSEPAPEQDMLLAEQEKVTLGRIDIDTTTSCIIQVYIQSAIYTTRG